MHHARVNPPSSPSAPAQLSRPRGAGALARVPRPQGLRDEQSLGHHANTIRGQETERGTGFGQPRVLRSLGLFGHLALSRPAGFNDTNVRLSSQHRINSALDDHRIHPLFTPEGQERNSEERAAERQGSMWRSEASANEP